MIIPLPKKAVHHEFKAKRSRPLRHSSDRRTNHLIDQQHLIALALGLATLGGFLFKQINKFKSRKIKFMKALSDNLYFKNLDNNAGVFHHLVDTAEEEEFKEAILAYYFLLIEEYYIFLFFRSLKI